jgi:hypothetical protein
MLDYCLMTCFFANDIETYNFVGDFFEIHPIVTQVIQAKQISQSDDAELVYIHNESYQFINFWINNYLQPETIEPILNSFPQFKEWFDNEFAYNRLGDPSDFNLHYADGIMGLNCTTPAFKQEFISKLVADHHITKLMNQIKLHGDTDKFIEYLNTINTWRNQDWKTAFSKVAEFY